MHAYRHADSSTHHQWWWCLFGNSSKNTTPAYLTTQTAGSYVGFNHGFRVGMGFHFVSNHCFLSLTSYKTHFSSLVTMQSKNASVLRLDRRETFELSQFAFWLTASSWGTQTHLLFTLPGWCKCVTMLVWVVSICEANSCMGSFSIKVFSMSISNFIWIWTCWFDANWIWTILCPYPIISCAYPLLKVFWLLDGLTG